MKAWELISDRAAWTRGVWARDKLNEPCPYDDNDAVKFCVIGAFARCYNCEDKIRAMGLLAAHLKKSGWEDLVCDWNDHRNTTHAEVVRTLKELDL